MIGFLLACRSDKPQDEPEPSITITPNAGVFLINEGSFTHGNSTAGYYTVTAQAAVSNNYNFIYVAGRLTIYPTTGTDKQYLHAFMPNKDILTVRVFSVTPALGDIVLYDIGGRPVIKRNLFMPVGFVNADLFISELPTGIYIVTVRGSGVDLKKTIAIMK